MFCRIQNLPRFVIDKSRLFTLYFSLTDVACGLPLHHGLIAQGEPSTISATPDRKAGEDSGLLPREFGSVGEGSQMMRVKPAVSTRDQNFYGGRIARFENKPKLQDQRQNDSPIRRGKTDAFETAEVLKSRGMRKC